MKKLIIICEEKYRKYGDYLSQLISLEDDTEDEIVGVKDGEVQAQVWLEKDYKANSAQLSSSQYIIFIGGSKLISEKSTHMNKVFSQFGMASGWLGKQAFITVEEVVSNKEYDQFLEFALSYQTNLKRLIEKKDEKKKEKNVLEDTVSNPKKIAKIAGVAEVSCVSFWGAVGGAGGKIAGKVNLSSKIKEQQYSCAIMKFYLNSLTRFLGMQ